ncbi:MAG: Hpt domain-containing protein [Bryobacteraceae bacterium]|nr:Hpt domain-containing protein [Bryobacteraceae bacterium]
MKPTNGFGIDLEAALGRVGGDEDLLREVAQIFLKESPGLIDGVRQALRDRDPESLEFSAHSLKGAVGNFGTGAAFSAALAIEQLARQGRIDEAGGMFSELERALSAVVAGLALMISESP